jgi:uncharacterized protein (TIGR02001 family)
MRNLLICGVFAAVAVAPALAQEVAITGNVALTTDYTFRGVSQTDESPAIQGGLDLSAGSFYLGTWASNINFGTGGANLELDVYGGYKFAAGPVAFDVGVIGYLYPSASDDAAELDYWEGYIKPSIALSDQFTLGGAIYYSPEFTGETGDGWYYEVNGAFVVSPEFSLSGGVGFQTVDTPGFFGGEDEYSTYNFGGTFSTMGLGLDLRYVGTDVDNVSIFDDRVVFSVKKAM